MGKWFAFLLVLVGSYETISRHFFGAPTIWAYDSLCMAGGVTYLLGASYTHLRDSHTRVDIIYSHLSPRARAVMDIVCSLIFFFPLMGVMLKLSIDWAFRAWKINEVMFNSFWYPPAAPYRTVFAIGLLLLVLQGVAKLIRDVHFLVRGKEID
ncbi:MAG: TRAP transporter small permease subunit [Desulfovibrionaceae bacterium]